MKLSVIIPAFNVEKYISNCIQSLLNQKIPENQYEILVIDDGSRDNTVKIVTEFQQNYTNIRLISHVINLGNGAARNTGIDNSNGLFICFVDADDYVSRNSLHKLVSLALDNDLDVLSYAFKHVTNSSHLTSEDDLNVSNIIEVIDGISFIGQNNYRDEVWWYFVRRDFLIKSNLRYYHKRRYSQDMYLTTKILSKAKRVAYVNYDIYRYRRTPNSIVTTKSNAHVVQHLNDVFFALKKCYSLRLLLIENGVTNSGALLRLYDKQQRYAHIIITRFIQSELPFKKLKKFLREFKAMGIYPIEPISTIKNFNTGIKVRALTFIFNRIFLLKTFILIFRFLRSLNKYWG
jgi:glycosyltransferase involved in cell wall biosynthesis